MVLIYYSMSLPKLTKLTKEMLRSYEDLRPKIKTYEERTCTSTTILQYSTRVQYYVRVLYELKTLGFNWTLTENENESTLETAQPDTGGTEQSRAILPPVTMVQRASLPTLHRKRGRPRKYPIKPPVQAWVLVTQPIDEQPTKRGRGRPRKSDDEKKRDKEAREAAKALQAVGEASPIVALNVVGEASPMLAVVTAVDLTAVKGAEDKKTENEEHPESATMLLNK
jgi:AT hook motif